MNKSQPQSSGILLLYKQFLSDGDSAAWICKVAENYSFVTLARLTDSLQPTVRQAAVFALGMIGNREAIEYLAPRLNDSDKKVRVLADDAIKAIESRNIPLRGRAMLERMLVQIESNHILAAVSTANRIIASYPQASEAYCRRALAHFNLGLIHDAIQDCRQCIALAPHSYMAYVGLGQCLLELDNPRQALEAFRDAVRIYPDLDTVRIQIKRLERMLRETT
jgi:tetratricopeptide (TPR) repeat protein